MKNRKNQSSIKNLVLTGLFIGTGLLVPYIMGHAAGIPGTVLLPMHLPVFLCGYICGGYWGLVAGMLTPVLSSLLTGMPVFFPVLPMMVAELGVYGFVSDYSYRKLNMPLLVSLPLTMLLGRLVSGVVFALLTQPGSFSVVLAAMLSSLVTGVPGIAIQLIFVPALVMAVNRQMGYKPDKKAATSLKVAKVALANSAYTCVLAKDGKVICQTQGKGVSPLIRLYETEEGRLQVSGASVADTTIGKAAAIILVLAKAKAVYGQVMSQAAVDLLAEHHIPYSYGTLVENIQNRARDGICPIEESVLEVAGLEDGYSALKAKIAKLMAAT